jgi:hypothetical protein
MDNAVDWGISETQTKGGLQKWAKDRLWNDLLLSWTGPRLENEQGVRLKVCRIGVS